MSILAPEDLTKKRLEYIVENAHPKERPCLCGCGNMTQRRFVPGHDAALRRSLEMIAREETGDRQKMAKSALTKHGWKLSTQRKVRAKAARERDRVAA